jgi:hypothetical protein
VAIRYHAWWAGYDPFYNYNTSENRARIQYYPSHPDGYYYTPYAWIDGHIRGAYNYDSWLQMVMGRHREESPLEIQLSGMYSENTQEGTLVMDITATGEIAYDQLHIMIALTESDIYYNGNNGTDYHHQTMRDMIPNASGRVISISEGESIQLVQEFSCPDPIADRNAELVVFAQAPASDGREVLQAAKVLVPNLTQTGIEDDIEIPESIALGQNYPNPFNAETKIDFQTNGGAVTLEVYDLTGALVRTLVDGSLEAGHYSATWNGLDESGSEVASGVYFYRLSSPDSELAKRMTLLK